MRLFGKISQQTLTFNLQHIQKVLCFSNYNILYLYVLTKKTLQSKLFYFPKFFTIRPQFNTSYYLCAESIKQLSGKHSHCYFVDPKCLSILLFVFHYSYLSAAHVTILKVNSQNDLISTCICHLHLFNKYLLIYCANIVNIQCVKHPVFPTMSPYSMRRVRYCVVE